MGKMPVLASGVQRLMGMVEGGRPWGSKAGILEGHPWSQAADLPRHRARLPQGASLPGLGATLASCRFLSPRVPLGICTSLCQKCCLPSSFPGSYCLLPGHRGAPATSSQDSPWAVLVGGCVGLVSRCPALPWKHGTPGLCPWLLTMPGMKGQKRSVRSSSKEAVAPSIGEQVLRGLQRAPPSAPPCSGPRECQPVPAFTAQSFPVLWPDLQDPCCLFPSLSNRPWPGQGCCLSTCSLWARGWGLPAAGPRILSKHGLGPF